MCHCQRLAMGNKTFVVAHNSKMPFYKLHKNIYKHSPGRYCKLLEERKNAQRLRNSKKRKRWHRKRLFINESQRESHSYGNHSEKPDLKAEEYELKKGIFLEKLSVDSVQRNKIMEDTLFQNLSPIWMEERRKRLTASNFGYVCNKLPYTKCDSLVKKMLYININTHAMKYGRIHEKDAIHDLKLKNINVQPCGLIIDEELPFLAATPDGLIDNTGILEIKCPASCSQLTPEESILGRKFTFWNIDKSKKEITGFNKKHIHHYQVQGQLHISKREYCLFVLWTPQGIKIEKIERDDSFWEKQMKEKLIKFYHDCLLPELIDPRFPRSLEIRNPEYIIKAGKMRAKNLT